MKIVRMFAFGDGVFIPGTNDFGNATALIAYGKDEARRVLHEHCAVDAVRDGLLADLDHASAGALPDVAERPTRRVVGDFVAVLTEIAFAPRRGNRDVTTVEVMEESRGELIFVFMPKKKARAAAVLGFIDAEGNHVVRAVFSKDQFADEVNTWEWLTEEQRATVAAKAYEPFCHLPHFCSAKPETFDGKLAMVFTSCYAAAQHKRQD